jgi:hypothetical protein
MAYIDQRGISAVIDKPFHHQVRIVGGNDRRNIRLLAGGGKDEQQKDKYFVHS